MYCISMAEEKHSCRCTFWLSATLVQEGLLRRSSSGMLARMPECSAQILLKTPEESEHVQASLFSSTFACARFLAHLRKQVLPLHASPQKRVPEALAQSRHLRDMHILKRARHVISRNHFGSRAPPPTAIGAWRRAQAMAKREPSPGAGQTPMVCAPTEAEVYALADRVLAWRAEHPKRDYVGVPLKRVFGQEGLPTRLQEQVVRVRAASGARRFLIRSGRVVTLPEIFLHVEKLCTCYDVYKLYMYLPIFHPQAVPESWAQRRSEPATASRWLRRARKTSSC